MTMARGFPYFVMEYIPNKELTSYAAEKKLNTRAGSSCSPGLRSGSAWPPEGDRPSRSQTGKHPSVGEVIPRSSISASPGRPTATSRCQRCRRMWDVDRNTSVHESRAVCGRLERYRCTKRRHALGVILELLTGHMPYDVSGSAVHEAIRMVCEVEPARISSINRSLKATSRRHAEGDGGPIGVTRVWSNFEEIYSTSSTMNRSRPPTGAPHRIRKFAGRNKAWSPIIISMLIVVGLIWTSIALGVISTQRNKPEVTNEALMTSNQGMEEQFEASMSIASAIGSEIYEQLLRLDASLSVREDIAERLIGHYERLWQSSLDSDVLGLIAEPVEAARIQANIDLGDVLGGSRSAYTNKGMPFEAMNYKTALSRFWRGRSVNRMIEATEFTFSSCFDYDVRHECVPAGDEHVSKCPRHRRSASLDPERSQEVQLASQATCVGQSCKRSATLIRARDVEVCHEDTGGLSLLHPATGAQARHGTLVGISASPSTRSSRSSETSRLHDWRPSPTSNVRMNCSSSLRNNSRTTVEPSVIWRGRTTTSPTSNRKVVIRSMDDRLLKLAVIASSASL